MATGLVGVAVATVPLVGVFVTRIKGGVFVMAGGGVFVTRINGGVIVLAGGNGVEVTPGGSAQVLVYMRLLKRKPVEVQLTSICSTPQVNLLGKHI